MYEEKELVYSDQTGKFPTTSSRGNKYLMVLYYTNGSYIMMEPMKSRHENEMIRAHKVLIERLKSRGFYPKKQMLDNEISKAYEKAIKEQGIEEVERVPNPEGIPVMQASSGNANRSHRHPSGNKRMGGGAKHHQKRRNPNSGGGQTPTKSS